MCVRVWVCVWVVGRGPMCVSERNKALVLIQLDSTMFPLTQRYPVFQLRTSHKDVLLSELLAKSMTRTKGSNLSESSWCISRAYSARWASQAAPGWILQLWSRDVISWTLGTRKPAERGRVACSRFYNWYVAGPSLPPRPWTTPKLIYLNNPPVCIPWIKWESAGFVYAKKKKKRKKMQRFLPPQSLQVSWTV